MLSTSVILHVNAVNYIKYKQFSLMRRELAAVIEVFVLGTQTKLLIPGDVPPSVQG
jgi:hypothetical protein